ncbi:MAG: MBL fold metallo-hydrolase [Proteobacteria bacterium]|nr:MBL fold metallo-hydrolase [Pseudomonadota bacterium]
MNFCIDLVLALLSGSILFSSNAFPAGREVTQAGKDLFRLTVLFNNVPFRSDLETGWGFSCLIEGPEKTILFDTGADGDTLLSNMHRLGLDPGIVDAVVLSHIHGDHTGGLRTLLSLRSGITVYVPVSFPQDFIREVRNLGAAVETVSGPRKLMEDVYSTGEMGSAIKEQALILDAREGLIVVTGCAHPDVADMTRKAATFLEKPVYLLTGGFHLGGSSEARIREMIARLKALGVKKIAPSHCTGDNAIRMFREAWGKDFIDGGLGAVIEFPR